MKCTRCNRDLKNDSNYCDFCGAHIERLEQYKKKETFFDIKLLIFGIILSILITLLVTGILGSSGVPLFFGGLFLPFFWKFKSNRGKE